MKSAMKNSVHRRADGFLVGIQVAKTGGTRRDLEDNDRGIELEALLDSVNSWTLWQKRQPPPPGKLCREGLACD